MKLVSILGKIVFLFLLIPNLHAIVKANLDKNAVYSGDLVTLTITASGGDITFPNIKNIDGFAVLGTSKSSSISYINGSMSSTKSVSYSFKPTKNVQVPYYEIEIDGVTETTDAMHIRILEPTASRIGDDFQLELIVSKKKVYVGEAIDLNIKFKYKVGSAILDANLEPFNPKHFRKKELQKVKAIQENEYIVYNNNYIIFPQTSGKLTLPVQIINVASREAKTNFVRWNKIFSKAVEIDVIALPENLDIQGDFKMSASIDKSIVNQNEPVNLTLTIKGIGNIDDIEDFKIVSKDESIFTSSPTIKNYLQGKEYAGELTQKFSFVADKDYIIKPITFRYFNIKEEKVITLQTKEFKIKVNKSIENTPQIQTLNTPKIVQKTKIIIQKEDAYIKYLFALIGLIIGALIVFIFNRKKVKRYEETPLSKRIKKAKNDKELYNILLSFSQDNKISDIIILLEENIYKNTKHKINKKELIEILEQD